MMFEILVSLTDRIMVERPTRLVAMGFWLCGGWLFNRPVWLWLHDRLSRMRWCCDVALSLEAWFMVMADAG
jgi:hypothetical protein